MNRGSEEAFQKNWRVRPEAKYNHWTPGHPSNQTQFAFKRHWLTFKRLLKNIRGGRCLEVGCGRGSISSYFAAAGFDCTLLDYSFDAVETAREIFAQNDAAGQFVSGDALELPFAESIFDVCVSIGLLEHFRDIATPLHEQCRVLRPGGMLLAYIVPDRTSRIQKDWNWVNGLLREIHRMKHHQELDAPEKAALFRNNFSSDRYLDVLKNEPVEIELVSGIYSLPMISHSPEFPFTLMSPNMERALVGVFETALAVRCAGGGDPWLCPEEDGQAFLIAARKKNS